MADDAGDVVFDSAVDPTNQQREAVKELMRRTATLIIDHIRLESSVGGCITLVIVTNQLLVALASFLNFFLQAKLSCDSVTTVAISSIFIYLTGCVIIAFWAYRRISPITVPLTHSRVVQAELFGEIIDFERQNRILGDRITVEIPDDVDPTIAAGPRPCRLDSTFVHSISAMKSALRPYPVFSRWWSVGFVLLVLIHLVVLGIMVPSTAHDMMCASEKKMVIGGVLGFTAT